MRKVLVGAGGFILLFVCLTYFFSPDFLKISYSAPIGVEEQFASAGGEEVLQPLALHLPTPEPLKAIYMTACVAATPSWRTSLKELIETTELNAVVIDIKDYTGRVSFPNTFPVMQGIKGCVVSDTKEFIEELHRSNIYVIGRISVFQDVSYSTLFPHLAVKNKTTGGVWKDHKGLSFIDVGAKPYWDYIVDISKHAYALGYDELNFDYVRYPSDGDMKNTEYTWMLASSTKADMLESFFAYLHDELKDTGAKTSVDLFGMTTTVYNDLGIGQLLEKALPYFDYIAPMIYPSHYPAGWNGFANPAAEPYQVIRLAMMGGIGREQAFNIARGNFSIDEYGATTTPKSKLRPWLQDFHLGATYDAEKVRAQIQATYDVGLKSWMLWSAANRYTKEALLQE
jgi:hypothetical protein